MKRSLEEDTREGKRAQTVKIHTEVHTHTVGLMMQAARDRAVWDIPETDDTPPSSPVEEYYQKPFW